MQIDLESGLKIGAFTISIAVFVKGIYEYTKAQKWKRAEFVSKEIKEFYANFDINRAIIMLDWDSSDIDLKSSEIEGKSKLFFDNKLILSALKTHKENPAFNDEQFVIKSIFDCLFDKLTMFENYIQSGLINLQDIKSYLDYWIKILADPQNDRKSKEFKTQLWKYMDEYGYNEVRTLCKRFGYNSI